MLAPGQRDVAAMFKGRFYHFASEDMRTKFLNAPYDYILHHTSPSLPPPRLLLLGPPGAGQEVQARMLADKYDLYHIDVMQHLQTIALSPTHPQHVPVSAHFADPEESPLDADVMVEVVRPFWSEDPFAQRGFVMHGFPRTGTTLIVLSMLALLPFG